ncbi:glycosyltransferase family 2 protein [Botrimarina mediterranea]|nr:glycosyltransferase [Botrimarina mediterranea]
MSLISICIPTYKRAQLLVEAVESCLQQDYRPIEILVGDDSPQPAGRQDVEMLCAAASVPLEYLHHSPGLGQAGNVNSLLNAAKGHRLLLLHDDDRLLPGALSTLSDCFKRHPEIVAAYGRQRLIQDDGTDLGDRAAESLNQSFRKSLTHAGLQTDSVEAALQRQFPNNAYLVATDKAKAIGFREKTEVGDACDTDFGVRLAIANPGPRFYLTATYTAEYRITRMAISRTSKSTADYYRFLLRLEVPEASEQTKQTVLTHIAANAAGQLARQGARQEAMSVYLSRWYGWRRRLSPRGLSHLARILLPIHDSMNPRH